MLVHPDSYPIAASLDFLGGRWAREGCWSRR
jgi:hypothetical protein